MRKIRSIFFLCVFYYLFLLPHKAFALNFTKSFNNPLTINTDLLDWNQQMVFQPHVIYENGVFKMWYGSFNGSIHKITYATSTDGVNWNAKQFIDLPIAGTSGVGDPFILKANNKYILFFAVLNVKNEIYKIESNDGIVFDQSSLTKVVTYDKSWERDGVFAPTAIFYNNTYYLFYIGWGNGTNLGLSTSTDGINWTKCQNSILGGIDAPMIFTKNSQFQIIFHTDTGIDEMDITSLNNCQTTFSNRQVLVSRGPEYYDINHMIAPSLVEVNDKQYLYYIGRGNDLIWKLDLATAPVTENTIATIIIPGLMASWNKNAILHNQEVNQSDWKLPSFIKEYQGLISSFDNHALVKNSDYFVFSYDWRDSLEDTIKVLDEYLNTKIWNSSPNKKINIIGHSLGGLVGRIYSQNHSDKINKLITVGSPNLGAAQVYKPLSAGEIDRENTWLWLAQKLILVINKNTVESDKITVNKHFPVLLDLFPTYDFLTDSSSNVIHISSMSIKNPTIPKYSDISNIESILSVIYGTDKNTVKGYKTKTTSLINQLIGNYSDGEPTSSFNALGDETVLSSSATIGNSQKQFSFSLNHGEIISQVAPQERIFQQLEFPYDLNKISSGFTTKISPSLVFLIKSPAQINVEHNRNKYNEEEGIIFVENAESGDYKLNIQGTDLGKYQVIVGQISESNDIWETLDGEITRNPPSSQTDSHQFYFNNQTALSIFPTITPTPFPTSTPTSFPTVTPLPTITPAPTLIPNTTSNSTTNQTTNNQLNTSTAPTPKFPVKPDLTVQNWTIPASTNKERLVSKSPITKLNKSKSQVLGVEINKKSNRNILVNLLILINIIVGIYFFVAYFGIKKVKSIIRILNIKCQLFVIKFYKIVITKIKQLIKTMWLC